MKAGKWAISLTCLGLGGLGAMLFSDRGRRALRSVVPSPEEAAGRMAAWTDSARQELDHIQQELETLERSMGNTPQTHS